MFGTFLTGLTNGSRLILMIGDDGVLCVPHKVKDTQGAIFAARNDAAANRRIMDFITRHPKTPVLLVADILAQDFRRDTLPRLSPFDRPKLVRRRLKQAFPQARLTAALNLNTSRTQILMTGLPDKSPLFEWLERLETLTPAIALLPVEGAALATKLTPACANGWGMLVARQRTGGFRQIVTHKGALIFTRLTAPAPDDASDTDIAALLKRDMSASLGYLSRLGLNDPAQLHVTILAPFASADTLENIDVPVHSITCLSPFKAATQLGLPLTPSATDIYADLLFAGWVAAQKRQRLMLMLPAMRKAKQTKIIRDYGIRATIAACVIALLVIGAHAENLFSDIVQMRRETAQIAELQSTLHREQAQAAPLTEPLGKMRQAAERQEIYAQETPLPWTAFTLLNQSLENKARVTRIDWQNTDTEAEIITADIQLTGMPDSSTPVGREQIVNTYQRIAHNTQSVMAGYSADITRYPFPAMPNESLGNAQTKDASTKLETITAQLSIRKNAAGAAP